MNTKQAQEILKGPLQFGAQPQIEALGWMALFNKAKQLAPDCSCYNCNGTGACPCGCETVHDCGVCDGDGEMHIDETQDYDLKELRELVREMEEEKLL